MNSIEKNESGILMSINNELYNEMYVQELETRLETDPLLTNGLLDFVSNTGDVSSQSDWCLFCNVESVNDD